MKYIDKDHVKIERIFDTSISIYKVGCDEMFITVGLGGLVNIYKEIKHILEDRLKGVDDE